MPNELRKKHFDTFSSPFSNDEIKKSKYKDIFEHLQSALEKCEVNNRLILITNEILKLEFEDDLEQFFEKILSIIPDFGFQIKRIWYTDANVWGIEQISSGIGPGYQRLHYLDEQVAELLRNNEMFFIHDTSKNHSIKFNANSDYPKTILGLNIGELNEEIGALWFASSSINPLKKDEVDALIEIKNTIKIVFKRVLTIHQKTKSNFLFETIFNLYLIPCFILNNSNITKFNNPAAKIIDIYTKENQENDLNKLSMLLLEDQGNIKIENKEFRIQRLNFPRNSLMNGQVCFLLDESQTGRQRKYLQSILEILSLRFEKPIKNISGYTNIIPLIGNIENSQKDYLQKISKEIGLCSNLTSDLLIITRLFQNDPLLISNRSILEFSEHVQDATAQLFRQKRIQLISHIDQKEWDFEIDFELFIQAFYLVLEFILDNLPLGSVVNLSAQKENNLYNIIISDNGDGFSEPDLLLLNQSDVNNSSDGRIRIADLIMNFHNGSLVIKSELGEGSKYIFSFPSNFGVQSNLDELSLN